MLDKLRSQLDQCKALFNPLTKNFQEAPQFHLFICVMQKRNIVTTFTDDVGKCFIALVENYDSEIPLHGGRYEL